MGAIDLYFYWPAVSHNFDSVKGYVKFDFPSVRKGILFGDECGAEGRLGELIEFAVGESEEDTAFAHPWISNHDELNFNGIWILHKGLINILTI